MHRVVRPDGRVLILDTDWDSIVWHSSSRERMNRVLEAWEQHAADCHLPRTLADRLSRVGFRVEARQIVPLFNPSYDANSYSGHLVDFIATFVTGHGISREEAQLWARDVRQGGERGDYFFSLNRYLFVAKKPA